MGLQTPWKPWRVSADRAIVISGQSLFLVAKPKKKIWRSITRMASAPEVLLSQDHRAVEKIRFGPLDKSFPQFYESQEFQRSEFFYGLKALQAVPSAGEFAIVGPQVTEKLSPGRFVLSQPESTSSNEEFLVVEQAQFEKINREFLDESWKFSETPTETSLYTLTTKTAAQFKRRLFERGLEHIRVSVHPTGASTVVPEILFDSIVSTVLDRLSQVLFFHGEIALVPKSERGVWGLTVYAASLFPNLSHTENLKAELEQLSKRVSVHVDIFELGWSSQGWNWPISLLPRQPLFGIAFHIG